MLNFKNGTQLAVQQDTYIDLYKNGKTINPEELASLENNSWVSIASISAPSNLVLRQWCLIDIFSDKPTNNYGILNMVDILSYKDYKSTYRLWSENYSYYNYSLNALNLWLEKFNKDPVTKRLSNILKQIDQGFLATSYSREGIYYPAPFGDLRDEPLRPDLQIKHIEKDVQVANVSVKYGGNIEYSIKAKPLGLNTHIPAYDLNVTVENGLPLGFKFYQGYDKKYKNKISEFLDTINIRRILSLF